MTFSVIRRVALALALLCSVVVPHVVSAQGAKVDLTGAWAFAT